jgi:methylthioribose-1-phosphate isomerase
MALTSIRTDGDSIEIIDQLVLPHSYVWCKVDSPEDAYDAIKTMKIRGAPAIASLAALSISSYLSRASKSTAQPQFLSSLDALQEHLSPILDHLYASRPTAVNLGAAITRLRSVMNAGQKSTSVEEVVQGLITEGRAVADEDIDRNKTMARLGAEWILRTAEEKHIDISNGVNVLTVCNTGSLATSVGPESLLEYIADSLDQGYGTALGVITYLHEIGRLKRA